MLENVITGVKAFRTVIFTVDDEKLILPVTPWKYSVTTTQNNKIVDILDFGEALIFGTAALKHLKLSCFLPATYHQYPFVVGDNREPAECIDLLTKWKEGKTPVRVIITDSPINLQIAIMKLNFNEKDGTRDIYYNLELSEYRDLNIPPSNYQKTIDSLTGLKSRPDAISSVLQSKLVENGLDLLDKSKAAYGNYSSLNVFKSKNGISGLTFGAIKSWKW